MDFIRPLLMPTLVTLIVATVWLLGSMKQMDEEAAKAHKPVIASYYLASTDAEEIP